jgi:hypothetical protein
MTLLAAAVVSGCGGSTTVPLIDLPDLVVTTPAVPRGELVQLEVVNTTASAVVLPSPVCTTRFELFSRGQWFDVEPTNPDCVGVPVTLAVGDRHPYGIATPAMQSGRYRMVVTGSNADGSFVVRSPAFTVE